MVVGSSPTRPTKTGDDMKVLIGLMLVMFAIPTNGDEIRLFFLKDNVISSKRVYVKVIEDKVASPSTRG